LAQTALFLSSLSLRQGFFIALGLPAGIDTTHDLHSLEFFALPV
jgi:hypothetical protein